MNNKGQRSVTPKHWQLDMSPVSTHTCRHLKALLLSISGLLHMGVGLQHAAGVAGAGPWTRPM